MIEIPIQARPLLLPFPLGLLTAAPAVPVQAEAGQSRVGGGVQGGHLESYIPEPSGTDRYVGVRTYLCTS
jgi:hypothetical protein